jgi:hypothetical protein
MQPYVTGHTVVHPQRPVGHFRVVPSEDVTPLSSDRMPTKERIPNHHRVRV